MIIARLFVAILALALFGAGVFWFMTRPDTLPDAALSGLSGDAERGETVFLAGGCSTCHAAPDAEGDDRLVLSGGRSFPSDFGTFFAPNISSDPKRGIGGWSAQDLANAMLRGVSPQGRHYYPAFPYTSYSRVAPQDVVDLHAYLGTLPRSNTPSRPHNVGFPFNIRRTLGLWKLLFLNDDWIVTAELSEQESRGRVLVETLGHCGECHTPRNALGGLRYDEWLSGAPNPTGKGRIPNITPASLDWSAVDIMAYFTTGFTPEYDVAGGHMIDVIANLKLLSESDRAAIVAYLARVPPVSQ